MRTRPITKHLVLVMVGAVSLLIVKPRAPYAQDFIGYSATGADAATLQATVDAFRNAVGNPNNGNVPGPFTSGRREINWDGGGAGAAATTFPVPMTTFNTATVARGAVFTTPGTSFEISGQAAGSSPLHSPRHRLPIQR